MPSAGRSPLADMDKLGHDVGSCFWTVDHAGWVVMLFWPDDRGSYEKTLEEALVWVPGLAAGEGDPK